MEIKPQDHPDSIGGIVWSECELRWINEKLAELTELRAFKQACEGQGAAAFRNWHSEFADWHYDNADGRVAGPSFEPLYLHPDPEAAQLRMRIAELEAQLESRDQQVAEACAAECEGIDAINSRGWGDVLAKRIRSG